MQTHRLPSPYVFVQRRASGPIFKLLPAPANPQPDAPLSFGKARATGLGARPQGTIFP